MPEETLPECRGCYVLPFTQDMRVNPECPRHGENGYHYEFVLVPNRRRPA